jgi:hypothetical protein
MRNYSRLSESCKLHRGVARYGRLEDDSARDSAADFEPGNLSVFDPIQAAHEPTKFTANLEIAKLDFHPGTFVLVKLHVNQHGGRRIECGLSIRYSQRLDVPVIDRLAETHQGLSRPRKF